MIVLAAVNALGVFINYAIWRSNPSDRPSNLFVSGLCTAAVLVCLARIV